MYEAIRDRESHFLLSHARDGISEHSSEMFLVSPNASHFSLCAWVCTMIYVFPQASAPLEEHEFTIFLSAQCAHLGSLSFLSW